MNDSPATPADGIFRAVLDAPDRDRGPGQHPVVSVRPDDDAEYLAAVAARTRSRVVLVRRGIEHGEWAELEEVTGAPDGLPLDAVLHQRWHTARPIVLRGLAPPDQELAERIAASRRLFDDLQEDGGLRAFLKARREALAPHFQLGGRPASLTDPERDIERETLAWWAVPGVPEAPRMKDLWVKSAWLSTHEDDRSLRLRISFGREGPDDASRRVRKHRRVAELAEALLPECALLHENEELLARLEAFVGARVFLTQHIAYWNAPEGGALFHHDAFEEEVMGGQRGVVYLQVTGRTAWLALSIEDLARRVVELAEYLEEGELPWVRSALFPHPDSFERFRRLTGSVARVRRELARPGCGWLGRVVGRGPEFTSLLADAGHAVLLEAGDAILLPNHGLANTCMHSVFSADDEPAYALSVAVRELHPEESLPAPDAPRPPRDPDRRHGRRR